MKYYWVYMMSNPNNTVIYIGVTNDLERRVQEHKEKIGSSFTKRYNVTKLVYYERFSRIAEAIAAEKRIKAGPRARKIELIESMNQSWKDLCDLKIASLRSQ
ncbi:MAG: GIY-YIG nuclease family protein [Planctomycetota bacterium]